MKKFKFTFPGGFPIVQENLDYSQESLIEIAAALAKISGHADQFVVSGCQVTTFVPGGFDIEYTLAAGWIFFGGELIRVLGGTVSVDTSTDEPFLQIIRADSDLTYKDGSTHTAKLDCTLKLTSFPSGTAEDATKFKLANLMPFGREADWTFITVTHEGTPSPDVSGLISYKKCFISNTVHIRGNLNSIAAPGCDALPTPSFYTAATLPAGYRPAQTHYFVGQNIDGTVVLDSSSSMHIMQINCRVLDTGEIDIKWIPCTGAIGYTVAFDTVIPLQ